MLYSAIKSPLNVRICGFLAACWLFLAYGCGNKPAPVGRSNQALEQFKLATGFQIELVASEPLLEDPVDMEIDELGNMYVVEMTGNPSNQSGTGKVKLLKDSNADGIMDKSFQFANGLRMPSGVMRWKKGILVTDPPNIIYFEDSNGDNIADIKNIILTGFDSTDLESNVNNPYYGLDNWIYAGNGGKSGPGIHYSSKPGSPILINNADGQRIRFRPETFELEMLSGKTQFGHTEDVAGHPLLVHNARHIFEEVITAKYLNRNPALLVSSATELIADHSNDVFPSTINPENQLLTDVGVFTAACGITAYLGGAFGEEYNKAVFVAEPAHNLIHVDKLMPKGATHIASRMDSAKEFLTSTDPWFRPVNFYIGPDGALYVVDYYRQFIEGPAFMSEEVLKTANLYNGNDKGRIYKITKSTNAEKNTPLIIDPEQLTNNNLIKRLSDKNIWWRKTAQWLLIDRKATDLVPALENIINNSNSPEGKLHALWTLDGLNKLSPQIVLKCLNDQTPFIRENAIKIAELHFINELAVINQLLQMKDDPDPRVRFQLTCTIGELKSPEAEKLIENILFKNIDDPWMQIAALSSSTHNKEKLFQTAIEKYNPANNAYPLLVERLSAMITNNGTQQEINTLLEQSVSNNKEWQPASLRGIATGLKGRKDLYSNLDDQRSVLMKTILHSNSPDIINESVEILKIIGINKQQIKPFVQEAQTIALDTKAVPTRRVAAIELLALSDPAKHQKIFTKFINNNEPVTVQLAAINALSTIPGTSSSEFVINKWEALTPEIKDEAINTFLSDRNRVAILLNALQSGKIPASMIGWPRSVRLMAGRWPKPSGTTEEDSTLIKKARTLLSRKETPKKDIIKQYYASLGHGANKTAGKKIFSENCGICHQVNGAQGMKLGPDLSTVRNWNPAELVTKILDPNQSIKGGYELWDIALANGEFLQGIITTETPTAITINNVASLPRIVARKDIKSISSSGMTIMPTGFEKQITKEEMAGLIAYLKNE